MEVGERAGVQGTGDREDKGASGAEGKKTGSPSRGRLVAGVHEVQGDVAARVVQGEWKGQEAWLVPDLPQAFRLRASGAPPIGRGSEEDEMAG